MKSEEILRLYDREITRGGSADSVIIRTVQAAIRSEYKDRREAGLYWRIAAPDEPGWYWCKGVRGEKTFIIQVREGDRPADGYEWSGPLQPPK